MLGRGCVGGHVTSGLKASLERQSHNLKVISSSLTRGIPFSFPLDATLF